MKLTHLNFESHRFTVFQMFIYEDTYKNLKKNCISLNFTILYEMDILDVLLNETMYSEVFQQLLVFVIYLKLLRKFLNIP